MIHILYVYIYPHMIHDLIYIYIYWYVAGIDDTIKSWAHHLGPCLPLHIEAGQVLTRHALSAASLEGCLNGQITSSKFLQVLWKWRENMGKPFQNPMVWTCLNPHYQRMLRISLVYPLFWTNASIVPCRGTVSFITKRWRIAAEATPSWLVLAKSMIRCSSTSAVKAGAV